MFAVNLKVFSDFVTMPNHLSTLAELGPMVIIEQQYSAFVTLARMLISHKAL